MMIINKKYQCLHCGGIVESVGECKCGTIKVVSSIITEGVLGKDYIDVTPQILNEGQYVL